jgi:hypothetical protein
MTSQIAIFNSLGVAVASDTVTTVSNEYGTKTTNNSQKIFPLSSPHRLVVIDSGSVRSNGIHIRLLLSEWSQTLTEALPTVSDYAINFKEWFANSAYLIPPDSDAHEVNLLLNEHYYEIKRRVKADAIGANSESEIAEIFRFHANSARQWLDGLELFDGATDQADAALIDALGVDLIEKVDYIFAGIPGLDEVREMLIHDAPLVLSRSQPSDHDTDLGFIGFGKDEFFAKSVKASCRARYGQVARIKLNEPFGASPEAGGSINTYAQSNVLHGFLRGAQHDVLHAINTFIWSKLTEGIDEGDEEGFDKARQFVSDLENHVEEFSFKQFVSPMLDTIDSFSLVDIASLARSLVGMQAIRSAASPEPASVGGFIESLVIDRANGIRWIHRLPQISES